jgi:thioredoxin
MWRALILLVADLLTAFAAVAYAAHTAEIYDATADATRDIAVAVASAQRSGKNVILDFGANWCGDCHALESQMKREDLAPLIARNYVVVHIDVARFDKNLDVAAKYHVPIRNGIPALAVLNSQGTLLYAMDQGQFADARTISHESVRDFFLKWVPKK